MRVLQRPVSKQVKARQLYRYLQWFGIKRTNRVQPAQFPENTLARLKHELGISGPVPEPPKDRLITVKEARRYARRKGGRS